MTASDQPRALPPWRPTLPGPWLRARREARGLTRQDIAQAQCWTVFMQSRFEEEARCWYGNLWPILQHLALGDPSLAVVTGDLETLDRSPGGLAAAFRAIEPDDPELVQLRMARLVFAIREDPGPHGYWAPREGQDEVARLCEALAGLEPHLLAGPFAHEQPQFRAEAQELLAHLAPIWATTARPGAPPAPSHAQTKERTPRIAPTRPF